MNKKSIPIYILAAFSAYAGTPDQGHQNATAPFETRFTIKTDTVINFEKMEAGKPVTGFTQTYTGKKQTISWQVVSDAGNKVAAQIAKNEGEYFNLLVLDNPVYQNFSVSVKIKAVAGNEDQGGGLVWRYVDNNNYYLARCNPLEKNFRFYRVVNGNRKQLKSIGSNIGIKKWFTLTITMNGNTITCSINGTKMIEATDDTFTHAGKIGLWTKADAQSYFDDLTIMSMK